MLEGCDEDDLRPVLGRQGGGDSKAVLLGHLDVEQRQIGLEPLDRLRRLPPVAGGANDFGAGNVTEEDPEAFERERLVVDEEGAQGHATSPIAGACGAGRRMSAVNPPSWARVSSRAREP